MKNGFNKKGFMAYFYILPEKKINFILARKTKTGQFA